MHRYLNLAAFIGLIATAGAVEIKPTDKGLHINGGPLGGFELSYPVFTVTSGKEAHPLVEAKTSGANASLKYEGGGTVEVVTSSAGDITFNFANTPADVKSFASMMLIDISFSRGGKWKAGDKEGIFPADKAKPAQFYSGNTSNVSITNATGDRMDVTAPAYTYVQITDNREWGWAIYGMKCFVPYAPGMKTSKFKIDIRKGSGDTKLIDTFGQSMLSEWAGKVKSEEELKSDVTAEQAYYSSFKTPKLDQYGGLPGSMESLGLKKTGFFHVEKKNGRDWLVDPAGNAFFHTGICGFQPSDDYTWVDGRENIYSWLPKKNDPQFESAYLKKNPQAFSFFVANTIRKYGQPYDANVFAGRMIDRVRSFGFNSIGAFSSIPEIAKTRNFPYVTSLPLSAWDTGIKTVPGAHETWDPFDEKTRAIVEKAFAEKLPTRANDPLLIGYFIVNEPRYDELPDALPALTGGEACKRKLVDYLSGKYKDIAAYNTAWKASAATFDELVGKGLAVTTPEAKADVKAFTDIFLDELFKLIATQYRNNDKNHLLIGNRLQPVTIKDEQLCKISGKYLDVMSYNYYTHDVDKDQLKRIYEWTGGKPMILSEFFWASPKDSGLTGGRAVLSQQERGLIYRNYVEQSASLGFVIGIEWFTLIDQATTGRWFSKYSGESANTGIFSVADRPWKPMVEEMAKTNNDIYSLLLGKRPPFAWEFAKQRGEN